MPRQGTLTFEIGGQEFSVDDWTDDTIWTWARLNTTQATPVIVAFGNSTISNGGGAAHTQRSTNVNATGTGGGLPLGHEFLVYSIQIKLGVNYDVAPGIGLADLYETLNRTAFQFFVQNQIKHEAPIEMDPPGSGALDYSTAVSLMGVPSPRDVRSFVLPIELEEGVPFHGTFNFGTALALATELYVELRLQGLFARPVGS